MRWSRFRIVLTLAVTLAALPLLVGLPLPAAPPVTVDEAIPDVGEQGATNLMVRIKGKGFNNGSLARFLESGGGPDPKITVHSTNFISSRELECDITIDPDAERGVRDIEVELLNGRKGKGTDTFSVIQAGGSGNEIDMDVSMDAVEVDPGGPADPGEAEVIVSYTNWSTQGEVPLTAQAVASAWAERCEPAVFASTEIDLDQPMQPQYNCTREAYDSVATDSPWGVSTSQTLLFTGLPAGDYIFFVDLNVNQSQNYDWKHGFAVGRVQ